MFFPGSLACLASHLDGDKRAYHLPVVANITDVALGKIFFFLNMHAKRMVLTELGSGVLNVCCMFAEYLVSACKAIKAMQVAHGLESTDSFSELLGLGKGVLMGKWRKRVSPVCCFYQKIFL